jgi:hypothetical protein
MDPESLVHKITIVLIYGAGRIDLDAGKSISRAV